MRYRGRRIQQMLRMFNSLAICAVFDLVAFKIAPVFAEFTTVINSPPTVIGNSQSIDSNTQVNVNTGGSIGNNFRAGKPDGTSSNVEVNISGGSVGRLFAAFGGSIVNISGGTVGFEFRAEKSTVNISGGEIRSGFTASDGSNVNILGGVVGDDFLAQPGSRVIVSGGSIGDDFTTTSGSVVNVSGGNFSEELLAGGLVTMTGGNVEGLILQANGNLDMSGGSMAVVTANSSSAANITGGRIGSFIALSGNKTALLGGSIGVRLKANVGSEVNIIGNEFRLDGIPIAGLEAAGSMLQFNLPSGSLLSGTLADGTPFAFTSDDEDSITDGTLTLTAAPLPTVGPPVITVPTSAAPLGIRQGQLLVVASGGTVSDGFNAGRGSTTVITDGIAGANFEAVAASIIVAGGQIGDRFDAFNGSKLSIYGGELGDFADVENGSVDLYGGKIGAWFKARNGTVVNVSGGEIAYGFEAQNGSQVNITGGSIKGLLTASNSIVNISGGSVGSFWALSDSTVRISGGSIGQGIRAGSRLDVYGGEFRLDGQLIDGLDAEGNSLAFNLPPVSVLSGTLADGAPFAFTGSQVGSDEIYDGSLVLHAQALPTTGPALISVPTDPAPKGLRAGQTLMVVDGGVIGDNFTANWDSTVNIAGGQVGGFFEAIGADVSISGGNVGPAFTALFGSTVNVSGGNVGEYFRASRGAVINISGGIVGRDAIAGSGSTINVSGGTIDVSFDAREDSIVNVSGGLIDDHFAAARRSLVNITGGTVNDLDADRESVVNISGGTVGHLQSFGDLNISNGFLRQVSVRFSRKVAISGGEIAEYFSTDSDGAVTVSGGMFNGTFEVIGNTVDIIGGMISANFTARGGSTANIFGGAFTGQFNANPESSINLFGTRFVVGGVDITTSLAQNVAYTITARDVALQGLLADGLPFDIDLNSIQVIGSDSFYPTATLRVTLVLPGDYNVDGVVDTADYVVWRETHGTFVSMRGSSGDGNFDGQVTQADYDVWRANFGKIINGSGAAGSHDPGAVPEPSGSVLVFLAPALLAAIRRCRFVV